MLILRGKKNKYLGIKKNILEVELDSVKSKIDNLLGGALS